LIEDRSWQEADWLPDALPSEWIRAFETTTHQPVMTGWKTTVHETRELLNITQRSLARAALANDEQTLEALGCYDKTRNGSGTITAVAAAYVATRAAARPLTGLLRTAFLRRADTDTLASMTASLLGAIHGVDWIHQLAQTVQDGPYLHAIGMQLAEWGATPQPEPGQQALFSPATSEPNLQVRTKQLEHFRDVSFSTERPPDAFPDGRRISSHEYSQIAGTGRTTVRRLRLRTEDGQSFIIDKVTKLPDAREAVGVPGPTGKTQSEMEQRFAQSVLKVTLRVSNLDRSLQFYRDILGLTLENKTPDSANFANGLTLAAKSQSPAESRPDSETRTVLVTIFVQDFHNTADRVRSSNLAHILGGDDREGREQLRIRDLDGHDLRLLPG
jgi:catechol 2,3-dioxygenase-like lactoylglutathione lyase family enzyme